MRILSFAVVLALTFILSPKEAAAQAVDCAVTPKAATCSCNTLGESVMADDKSSIIACTLITPNTANTIGGQPIRCSNAGGCSWKSMNSSSTPPPPASATVYQCPLSSSCDDGQIISGSWASIGCTGQLSIYQNSCINVWWYHGGRSCTNACTRIGVINYTP